MAIAILPVTPESPRWLIYRDRKDEVYRNVNQEELHNANTFRGPSKFLHTYTQTATQTICWCKLN